jgi:hypothetical protein
MGISLQRHASERLALFEKMLGIQGLEVAAGTVIVVFPESELVTLSPRKRNVTTKNPMSTANAPRKMYLHSLHVATLFALFSFTISELYVFFLVAQINSLLYDINNVLSLNC